LTVASYFESWVADVGRTTLRPATIRLYVGVIRNHIEPKIGGTRLQQLTPIQLSHLLGEMDRTGASSRLRQIAHNLLRRALTDAVRWDFIARKPAEAIKRPTAPRPEIRYLNRDQVRTLLFAARGDRLEALYALAVTTGLRQGKLLGLQWGDVDWEAGTLQIQRQLLEHGGRHELGSPKTPRARRRVQLPQIGLEALRVHRAAQRAQPHSKTLDLHGLTGRPAKEEQPHPEVLPAASPTRWVADGAVSRSAPHRRD
jgi:integrase